MTPPKPLALDAIEARATAATAGPWVSDGVEIWLTHGDIVIATLHPDRIPEDAEFIGHSRMDVPALAAEVRRLRAELDVGKQEKTSHVASALHELARVWEERDTLRDKVAELERDENKVWEERNWLRIKLDRMRPVVIAAEKWSEQHITRHPLPDELLCNAVDAYHQVEVVKKEDRA